jgi:glycine cleavage system H protein
MTFPDDLRYTNDHEWVRIGDGNTAYIGITDFAQSELGDLVYIEVATEGKVLQAHEIFGTVEAVKTTSELFMPVQGRVLEFNKGVDDSRGGDPGVINKDPYGNGWIIRVELSSPDDVAALMDAAQYRAFVGA